MRHLTSLLELTPDEVRDILQNSAKLKADCQAGTRETLFPGRVIVQIFEKPSLRTRTSFEAAMIHLGGSGMFMTEKDAGFHGRESTADIARVVTSMADVVTLRTFSQKLIEDFAAVAACPVINALSDASHPCQALTDILTMQEVCGKEVAGKTLVYVGDGNNVAVSLAEICAMLGVRFVCSSPDGYELDSALIPVLESKFPGAELILESDPGKAVKDADVIYTDVWASMGQESEKEARIQAFQNYQINEELLAKAPSSVKFMHCLPAKRGLEVTDGVMDGPACVAFQQAENRMHLAKGLIAWLLEQNA